MDPTCMTLLGAMAVAITGMAVFIKKLYGDVQEAQKARTKTVQDMLAFVVTIRNEVGDPEENA